jgi:hypothetical protein
MTPVFWTRYFSKIKAPPLHAIFQVCATERYRTGLKYLNVCSAYARDVCIYVFKMRIYQSGEAEAQYRQ